MISNSEPIKNQVWSHKSEQSSQEAHSDLMGVTWLWCKDMNIRGKHILICTIYLKRLTKIEHLISFLRKK